MASAAGLGKSGRRKSLDAEINLVPFIDLLSALICFLLVTAVWVQIGAVQIKQSHGSAAAASPADSIEMNLRFSGPTSFELSMSKAGRLIKKETLSGKTADELFQAFDASLLGLEANKTLASVFSAILTPAQGLSYGDLVRAMDILRRHGVANLGVSPGTQTGSL